jgi:aryl-alcohol dehydrogenase-like predicted oxidoreductase
MALVEFVKKGKKATPAQIALAWLLAQRPYIVPSPARPSSTGSKKI